MSTSTQYAYTTEMIVFIGIFYWRSVHVLAHIYLKQIEKAINKWRKKTTKPSSQQYNVYVAVKAIRVEFIAQSFK